MDIRELPIPPRPGYFGPDGAPPGVALLLDAFATLDDGKPWTSTRETISPRVGIVHTNAANYESSSLGQIGWGRRARNNTKPHYIVCEPVAYKVLRTDRRGIANSTEDNFQAQTGERDCSFWTYAIETADTGTLANPRISDFLERGQSVHGPVDVPHAELVARIFAYESIVWGHPLTVPAQWNGSGIATHTWPYPYPHYTIKRGKTCPGDKKIERFQRQIIERANMIRRAWEYPVGNWKQGEIMGAFIKLPKQRLADTRSGVGVRQGALRVGETITVAIPNAPNGERAIGAVVNVTGAGATGPCFLQVDGGVFGETSDVNPSTGDNEANMVVSAVDDQGRIHIRLGAGKPDIISHVLVDLAMVLTASGGIQTH